MPKKIHTNPKADAARERKEETKKAKKSAAEKAAEDAKWADEGSTAAEKRAREKAAKEAEEQRKRAEKRALKAKEEAEAAAISGKAKVSNAEKMTRAQITRQLEEAEERRKAEAEARRLEALKLAPQVDLTPNLNRALNDEFSRDAAAYGAENVIHARSIDGALAATTGKVLSTGSAAAAAASAPGIDLHPEKRMKSAYADYEECMMPIMREENPHLKLSQYKEQIFKLWQKAPENPRNIRLAAEAAAASAASAEE